MWIEEILIESFGAYGRFRIEGLEPGLTVIIGPNEAGKTTLMEFVRSIFFGFKRKNSRTNTYETPGGTARSGRIAVRTSHNGRSQIRRVEKRGQKEGMLTILDDNGNLIEHSAVPVFGPGLQRNVYEALFAFDLDQMRQLDHDALRGKIVAAALGSVQVNPLDILKKLDEQSKKRMKRSNTDGESLPAIQSRIGEIDRKLKALQDRPNLYAGLTKEWEQAAGRRRELSDRIQEAENELPGLEKLIQRREEWNRLVFIEGQLEKLEHGERFPVEGIPRLEQALEQQSQAEAESLEIQTRLEQILERVARLNPDPGVLEHAEAIHTLSREAAGLANLPVEIQRCDAALNRSRRMLTSEIATVGEGWDEKRVSESDTSLPLEQEIRVYVNSFHDRKERIRELQTRVSESKERCRVLEEKVAAKRDEISRLAARCEGFLSLDSRTQLQEWKNNLERLHDLEERLSEQRERLRSLVVKKTEVEKRIQNLESENRPAISGPVFWGFVFAFLAAGLAGFVASGVAGSYFWLRTPAIAVIVAVPFLAGWRIKAERRRKLRIGLERESLRQTAALVTRDLVDLENRRRSNLRQIESLKHRSRQIAEDVLQNPSALVEDIIRAELRSAAAEGPFRRRQALESGLQSDVADQEEEESRKAHMSRLLAEEFRALEELKRKWERFISGRGLPHNLDAEITVDLVRKLGELKRSIQQIQEEHAIAEGMKDQWQQFVLRVEQLARTLNKPPLAGSAARHVEQWVAEERETRETWAERKAIFEKAEDLKIRLSVTASRVVEARDRIAALYEAAGVDDEEAFRERAAMHAQFKRLDQERLLLVEGLVSGLEFLDEGSMRESLSARDWSETARRSALIRSQLSEMRKEAEDLATRCGSLGSEIKRIEQEDESDRLLAERQEFVARMSNGVKELIVTKIASHLLEGTLRLYELEKQPRVLERTSEIFKNITGNGFKRVIFPLDGATIKVERADGSTIDEELLSRGTLEQLYLSLRLAHLDVYHRDKPSIPLVMDDVLVNFDPSRAARTAAALTDFSEDAGIQVLFFTCHPHTADLFPQRVARVQLDAAISDGSKTH
ncbi:MAG: AAA family ATPase [Deltaproteobacteria bacterium]|nr:AAA family ATPase [Deltaproteobacteria bacterium]